MTERLLRLTNPAISIVMPIKNGRAVLERSLPIILDQSVDLPYELIAIDSGSTDGGLELLQESAARDRRLRVETIPPEEFHHARTRNMGAALARGRYLVFLGGDALPAGRGWLANLLRPLREAAAARRGAGGGAESRVAIAATYGRQVPRPDANAANLCRMAYNYPATSHVKNSSLVASPKERYHFSSVTCAIDTDLVPRPVFDEHYPVHEDMTLAKRIVDGGMSIAYCADSVVIHSHDYGIVDIFRRYFDTGIVYRGLGIFGSSAGATAGDAGRYLRTARAVLRRRGFGDLLSFAAFFVASAAGVRIGVMHERLPRWLCRRITKYRLC